MNISTIENWLRVRHFPTVAAASMKWYMESEELDIFDAFDRVREDFDCKQDRDPEDWDDMAGNVETWEV